MVNHSPTVREIDAGNESHLGAKRRDQASPAGCSRDLSIHHLPMPRNADLLNPCGLVDHFKGFLVSPVTANAARVFLQQASYVVNSYKDYRKLKFIQIM